MHTTAAERAAANSEKAAATAKKGERAAARAVKKAASKTALRTDAAAPNVLLPHALRAKRFHAMLEDGTLHPIHKDAYDVLANKNGGRPFFSHTS